MVNTSLSVDSESTKYMVKYLLLKEFEKELARYILYSKGMDVC
jgi:hypothetical protein